MHMGTLAHTKFIADYIQLALRCRVPAMIMRMDEASYGVLGMDRESAEVAVNMALQLEEQGLPVLDGFLHMPLDESADRVEAAKRVLSQVPAGITHMVLHPCQDTPEVRAIAPDWPSRVADYHAFSSEELRRWVNDSGLIVLGYLELRTAMRSSG